MSLLVGESRIAGRRVAACLLLLILAVFADRAPAATNTLVVSLSGNGEISWTEDIQTPAGYEIQFASQVGGPWGSAWEAFAHVQVQPSGGSIVKALAVPMFYRVVRKPGFDRLPAAIVDADFHDDGQPSDAKFELGRLLFFDKILSGNQNISCATCHHPLAATGDGLSLPIGEGGRGLGVTRDTGFSAAAVHERVPRNAPPVFNLGAKEFATLFHDGRVTTNSAAASGFDSPAGSSLPTGLENALAVQAMFPVTSGAEMAGHAGENGVADFAAAGNLPAVWEALAARLRAIPEYVARFIAAFPDVTQAADINYGHAANAIAAFENRAWRADNSPFDRFLRGDSGALSTAARRGMDLFYGKADCVSCHSGKFQTDQAFHSIAMVQIGPGKGDDADGRGDFGRERVSGQSADRYKFRTPSLRNVALTGPWGHAGAYDSLEAVVRHHLDPVAALNAYDTAQAVLPPRADLATLDFVVQNDSARRAAIAATSELSPMALTDAEVGDLLAFLHALTDANLIDLRRDVPRQLPSGLTLAE